MAAITPRIASRVFNDLGRGRTGVFGFQFPPNGSVERDEGEAKHRNDEPNAHAPAIRDVAHEEIYLVDCRGHY